uniref:Uncharacterized protein n=1 Tax=Anguilla anguilla TaxID=7936 RepID=A0A0E9UEW5_ANGAN
MSFFFGGSHMGPCKEHEFLYCHHQLLENFFH